MFQAVSASGPHRFVVICQLCFAALFAVPAKAAAEEVYQEPSEFISEAFQNEPPQPSVISIIGERRDQVAAILEHRPAMLRTRYWMKGGRSAWILEEIGKTRPITAGIVVQDGLIEDVRVLVYRESHGAEVRHSFFTNQFAGAGLDGENRLSQTVDGISGATLSVYAMRKLARLALYLDREARAE